MDSPKNTKDNKTLFGILSYLGILVIIPLLMKENDAFIKFHVRQGLVLLCIEVIVWILSGMVWMLWPVYQIINLGVLILIIIGIINVVQGREKELPLVGGFSRYFSKV